MAGTVRVYDQALMDSLLTPEKDEFTTSISKPLPTFSNHTSSGPRSHRSKASRVSRVSHVTAATEVRERQKAKAKDRHKLFLTQQEDARRDERKHIQERLEVRKRKHDAEFEEMYRKIMDGATFTKHIDKMLHLQDTADRQRQEQLFAEWEEKVFQPICKQISGKLDKLGHATISRMQRKEYAKFLKAADTGQAIFLDTVCEGEYDPFVLNRHRIKADTSAIKDPVKRVLDKAEEEKTMVDSTAGGSKTATHRNMLDVQLWHTGRIEATPHGHFAMMMNDPIGTTPRQPSEKAQKITKSSVVFDQYNVDNSSATLNREFPRGKKPLNMIRETMIGRLKPGEKLQLPESHGAPYATDAIPAHAAAAAAAAGAPPASSESVRSARSARSARSSHK